MAKSSNNSGNDQADKLINLQAQQLAAQVANWAAQLEFQKERLRLLELPEMQGKLQVDVDRLAFDKAQAAWENAFKEASLTGTYNGQPTLEWLTQQAQLTGVLNGQQTLQGKLTDAQIAQMNNSMRLANEEFMANTTGYINGRPTFDREKFMAGQAQDAWKFLSTLTGPSNAFKQARAISSMPGGMSDLMSAWAGQYANPGSTAVGSGGPASLGGLMLGAAGNYNYPAGGLPQSSGVNYMQGPPPQIATPGGTYVPGVGIVYPGAPAGAGGGAAPTTGGAAPGGVATLPTPGSAPIPGGNGEPPAPTGLIPGRGFPMSQWNPATQAAAAAWEAAHPGYKLDGSAVGYYRIQPTTTAPYTPTETVPGTPASGNEGGGGEGTFEPVPGGEGTGWNGGEGYIGDPVPQTGIPDAYPTGQGFQAPAYQFTPSGYQAPVEQWNYSPTMTGSMQVYPPGTASPYDTPDISTPYAVSPYQAQNMYQYGGGYGGYGGGQGGAYGQWDSAGAGVGPQPTKPQENPYGVTGTGYSGMLLPNQINAKNYNNSYQYQKDLGWAAYEDAGWDKSLAQEAFARSLPKVSGPKMGSFAY